MSRMKKVLLVALIGLFVVGCMVGCSGSKTAEAPKTAPKVALKTTTPSQPQPTGWGQETRDNLMKGAGAD